MSGFEHGPTFFSKDPVVANGRVIRPGANCGKQGGTKTFTMRAFPAGTFLVIYGDMETQTPFVLECTCGQTPCTYMAGSRHMVDLPPAALAKGKDQQ